VTLKSAIQLIEAGISRVHQSAWADLGCGDGLFTRALASLLEQQSEIYAVDVNKVALAKIQGVEGIHIKKVVANFERDELPFLQLDGILMANSLHFVEDKESFIKRAESWLSRDGSFVIVEYDMDTPNRWVPYPVSYESCAKLFLSLGWKLEKVGSEKSRYDKSGMYAARIHH
jgi:ubiquinone/menaquinone biosynthesis C-methylase UbiE